MATGEKRALEVTQADRRALLARRLIPVIKPLIEKAGGYPKLSVERIIRAGKISRSSFYTYFDDKSDLLVEMSGHVVSDLLDTGDSWWTFPHDAGREELRAALRPPLEAYLAHGTIFIALADAASSDARAQEQLVGLADGAGAALARHISACQRASSAAAELDPDRTAAWLVWMIERGLYQLVTPAADAEGERRLDALTDLIWRTLYAGCR